MPSTLLTIQRELYEEQARVDGRLVVPGVIWQDVWVGDEFRRLAGPIVPVGYEPELGALQAVGSMLLVTQRPSGAVWLVGVLEDVRLCANGEWAANGDNVAVARDITSRLDRLSLARGRALTSDAAALHELLLEPRELSDDDEALLRAPAEAPSLEAPPPVDIPTGASSRMATALRCLVAEDPLGALDALLYAWGGCKAVATADAIERLGWLVDRSLPPLGTTYELDVDEWMKVAASRRSADLRRLLRRIGSARKKALGGIMTALGGFVADPRIVWPLMSAVADFSPKIPARPKANRLIREIGDGRICHGHRPQWPPYETMPSDTWKEHIDDWTEALAKVVPAPPELGEADRAALEAIVQRLAWLEQQPVMSEDELVSRRDAQPTATQRSETELLAAIYRAPHDDEARMVYGDWLLERGAPRGDLVVLQRREREAPLTATERKQAEAIVARHGPRWIAPLEAVVAEPRFSLGILSGCTSVAFDDDESRDALVEDPQWSTLEEIDDCDDVDFLCRAPLTMLRSLGIGMEALAALSRRTDAPPIERLASVIHFGMMDDAPVSPAAWAEVARVGSLTSVRTLHLRRHHHSHFVRDDLGWLADSPLGAQLECLRLGLADISAFIPWLGALPHLRTLELGSFDAALQPGRRTHPSLRITRVDDGDLVLTLEVGWPYFKRNYYRHGLRNVVQGEIFRAFPVDRCPALDVRYVGRRRTKAELQRLSDELGTITWPFFERVSLPDGRVL